jgi:hypothetical protein
MILTTNRNYFPKKSIVDWPLNWNQCVFWAFWNITYIIVSQSVGRETISGHRQNWAGNKNAEFISIIKGLIKLQMYNLTETVLHKYYKRLLVINVLDCFIEL